MYHINQEFICFSSQLPNCQSRLLYLWMELLLCASVAVLARVSIFTLGRISPLISMFHTGTRRRSVEIREQQTASDAQMCFELCFFSWEPGAAAPPPFPAVQSLWLTAASSAPTVLLLLLPPPLPVSPWKQHGLALCLKPNTT